VAKTKKQKAAAKARRTRAANKNKKNNKKSRASDSLTKAWGKISTAASGVVTLQLITGSDMAASTGQPMADRAKNFANSLLGRVTGYTPFSQAAGADTPQTISIEGMFNKYTAISLGLIGYSLIPAKILPHKQKAKVLGKKVLGGSLLGGLFKPSTNPHNTNLLSQTRMQTPMIVNTGVT